MKRISNIMTDYFDRFKSTTYYIVRKVIKNSSNNELNKLFTFSDLAFAYAMEKNFTYTLSYPECHRCNNIEKYNTLKCDLCNRLPKFMLDQIEAVYNNDNDNIEKYNILRKIFEVDQNEYDLFYYVDEIDDI